MKVLTIVFVIFVIFFITVIVLAVRKNNDEIENKDIKGKCIESDKEFDEKKEINDEKNISKNSLIKCSMCKNYISPNAEICPFCGEPIINQYNVSGKCSIRKIKGNGFFSIIGILFFIVSFFVCFKSYNLYTHKFIMIQLLLGILIALMGICFIIIYYLDIIRKLLKYNYLRR